MKLRMTTTKLVSEAIAEAIITLKMCVELSHGRGGPAMASQRMSSRLILNRFEALRKTKEVNTM